MKMKYFLASLFCLSNLIACTQGRPDSLQQKIGSVFKEFDHTDRPGCAVLVVKDGEVVFKKGYGMANLEYDAPITPATVFDIASVSKQFTGYAISTLIQEGKIKPDDEIHKYLPDVPEFGKPMTIRHLIHHTSGLRDWPEALHAAGWRWDEAFRYDDILRMVRQQKELDFEPGSVYQYSNTGYNLLAAIVAKVTGESFPVWIKEHIFEPLKMDDSQVLENYSNVIKHLAASYYEDGGAYHKANDELTAWGSSSIFTTVEDLAKWVIFFQHGLDTRDPVILRMTETDQLNNGERNSYAYGLDVGVDHGFKNINHTGGWASFATIISNYPDQKLSIIVLSNGGGVSPGASARRVAELFLKSMSSSSPAAEDLGNRPTAQVDTQLLQKYLGTYQLGPHWSVSFTLENGRMMSQANGEDKFPADMKGSDLMWVPAYNSSVTFLDVTDKANSIRYHNKVSPRVKMLDVAGISLADYCGIYYSPELETTYELKVVSGKLTVHHMRLGDFPLNPDQVVKDEFSGATGTFSFIRNSQHAVTGFTLSGGRIRNIRFEKK
jgi:CubicO group peptidase (beta-lactamase class C family)